jgi:hypothetical protein
MKTGNKSTDSDIINKFLQDDADLIYYTEQLSNSSNILPEGLDVNFVYNNMVSI